MTTKAMSNREYIVILTFRKYDKKKTTAHIKLTIDSGNFHVKYNSIETHMANIKKQIIGKSLLSFTVCI